MGEPSNQLPPAGDRPNASSRVTVNRLTAKKALALIQLKQAIDKEGPPSLVTLRRAIGVVKSRPQDYRPATLGKLDRIDAALNKMVPAAKAEHRWTSRLMRKIHCFKNA